MFHKDTNGPFVLGGNEINKINSCLWVYRGRSSLSFGIKTFGAGGFFCARSLKYAAYSQPLSLLDSLVIAKDKNWFIYNFSFW